MIKRYPILLGGLMALVGVAVSAAAEAETAAGARHFFYLSDQRIVTLELFDSTTAVLNYFNLSQVIDVLHAPRIVILDEHDKAYRGHVFQPDEVPDPSRPYRVTQLIQPATYDGYSVLGNFNLENSPERALLNIGGRILDLEAVSEETFERLAKQIGNIKILTEDGETMLREAGFHRGFGSLYFADSPEFQEVAGLFPEMELLPPVLLEHPAPLLPSSAAGLADPVVIRLRAGVSAAGGIHSLSVLQGVNAVLDQMAIDTVRNSWVVLPAISKGEVAASELTLNVVFQRSR